MMALYIPMQPSSKTPMMALSRRSCCGEACAESPRARSADFDAVERLDVAEVVLDRLAVEPAAQAVQEELVGEVLAPEGGVADAGLRQRAVQVEHADQARPLAAPVGDGQDRPLVGIEPVQDVMAVLPDGLGHDQRRVGRDRSGRPPCRASGCR